MLGFALLRLMPYMTLCYSTPIMPKDKKYFGSGSSFRGLLLGNFVSVNVLRKPYYLQFIPIVVT